MKKLSRLITSCALLISSNAFAGSFLLNEYNLVTIDGVNSANLHVDGQSLIGSDLRVQNNTVLGQNVGSSEISAQIGGEFSTRSGINTGAGATIIVDNSLDENGDAINNVNQINSNQVQINNQFVNNGRVESADLSELSETVAENLINASETFSNLSSNSEFVNTNRQTTQISLGDDVNSDDYAVLDLAFDDRVFTNSPNQTLELLANVTGSVAGVIINVSGINITSLSFLGASAERSTNILFNFFEAETITLQNQFFGSILAPFAELTSTNNIEGSVGVLSIGSAHSGEIHDDLTTVTLPETPEEAEGPVNVPEPSTWILFAGLAFAIVRLRKIKTL